jgi:hypothetical protein
MASTAAAPRKRQYVANFQPQLRTETAQIVPEPIFIAALIGTARLRLVELPEHLDRGRAVTTNSDPILYLDLDGVLLRRRHAGIFDAFEIAPDCVDFLEWGTVMFRCRWLSSRCRQGWPDGVRRAFGHAGAALDDPRWRVLDQIEKAAWRVSKTEAIDPASDFWWLDDDPTEHNRDWLCAHHREDRLIEISSDRDPTALAVARMRLEQAIAVREPVLNHDGQKPDPAIRNSAGSS